MPATPPPLPTPSQIGLRMVWEGWDGNEWELTDWRSGVYLPDEGIEGLHLPEYVHYVQDAPGIAGQTYNGSTAKPRDVFWPLCIWTEDGSIAWADEDAKFWRTIDPERSGKWRVWGPRGTCRTLRCRLEKAPHSYARDPVYDGWAVYGLNLKADQPYWEGPQITTEEFRTATGRDFLPAASGDGYWVSPGSTLESAAMTNPGEVDAWPRWSIGESDSSSVGVGGAQIVVPFAVPADKVLVIQTDPRIQTATLHDLDDFDDEGAPISGGEDVTVDLGDTEFAPIPAGEGRKLDISLTGPGAIKAAITPLYRRAW
ncbi:hypothetical protein [Sinomonas soli]